jgi:hypothetical protein
MNKLFAILLIILCQQAVAQKKEFYLSAYGAKGDGVADDKVAIQNCIKDAYTNNGIAVITPGKYRVSKAIYFFLKDNNLLSIKGQPDKKSNYPVIFTDDLQSLFVFESDPNKPAGNVAISQLELRGNNVPYSKDHPYFGKHDVYASGVAFFNLKTVNVTKLTVKDIYGEGINVRNWNYDKTSLSNRYSSVKILNNKILNCWGANPPKAGGGPADEYGDGVYVSNATNILIQGNQIINNLAVTRQFGRAGIVIEYNCEGAVIEKNIVSGYDRDIHLEGDLGGHTIRNNRLTGSDFAICVWGNLTTGAQKPISILNNYLSNEGIPANLPLITVRGQDERALISFYAEKDSRKNSVISGNTFNMTPSSAIVGKSFMKVYESDLQVTGNIFNNQTKNKVGIYYHKKPQKVANETYRNVDVFFNKSITPDFIKSNNKLSNSTSNTAL